MNESIQILIDYLTQNGGIPLVVETVTKVNWPQFAITLFVSLLGMIFIFMIMASSIKEGIGSKKTKSSLKKISKITKKNVMIIKHTSQGLFSQSMIDNKSLKEFQKALIDFEGKDFDIVFHTPGGSIFYTMMISKLIKNYPGKIRAFIPSYSMSGGTILALSCNEVHMNEVSCMGPVDPQLGSMFTSASARGWKEIFKVKGKKADDSTIAMNFTGSQYTKTIKRLLASLIKDKFNKKDEKAKRAFLKLLTSGDVEHALQLSKDELIELGLSVETIKDKLNKEMIEVIASEDFEGIKYVKKEKKNKFRKWRERL